jgi:exodeoxyribonuclease III
MRIVTWNINSVRLRINLIQRLIDECQPDVICLQETKTMNVTFPQAAFVDSGYKHQYILGMKSYNGVAILSRQSFTKTAALNWQGREDCRHIFVKLDNGTELHNCYVPAGGDIPDPCLNPKFAHKLGFLDEKAVYWKARKDKKSPKILLGDLNVAPLDNDVWSHKQMTNVVSHTPIEINKLKTWQQAHQWVDVARYFVPPEKKLYSWWSYRAQNWNESDRGRRLDHIWVTPSLVAGLKGFQILRGARGWEPKPSDHVPVIMDLA